MFSSCNWRRASIRILLICATVISCVGAAMAQTQATAADLQGYVRDQAGAAVAGATVTARNPATNFSRDTTTNDEGYYQIVNLPPGDYEVTASAPTFSKSVVSNFILTVGARADLNVELQAGDICGR
jgi:protocatechuate 3,4-dioxygenase beta subunit